MPSDLRSLTLLPKWQANHGCGPSQALGVQIQDLEPEVEGHGRIYAIADEDLDRETEEKTSAVHFLRFEFGKAAKEAVRAGATVTLGCDHTHYPFHLSIAAETLAALAGDLR